MNPDSKHNCIFCVYEIQENWKNCPNCGFDLSSWNTFEKNVDKYRGFMTEMTNDPIDLRILKETLKANITNPSISIIKIFEAIKKLEESGNEIDDPILKSKYILLKTIRNNQCAHGEKDFKDIKMVGIAFDVLDMLLQERYGVISSYDKEISVFVPPNNWDDILKKIYENNLIVISGEPFSGKTTLLYSLARVLLDKGYKIEDNIEKIKELFDFKKDSKKAQMMEKWNQKNVFVLDNFFSEYQSLEFWSKILIKILDNPQGTSKFLIGIKKNRLEEFFKINDDETQLYGKKLVDFRDRIFELGVESYGLSELREILKTNADFIKLEPYKMSLILKNIDNITKKLLLPGDLNNFLEEVETTQNFDENKLKTIITEISNRRLNIYANRIRRLKEIEKTFIFTIYINENISNIDELRSIYESLVKDTFAEHLYFDAFVKQFEGKFLRKKDQGKNIEFAQGVYIEAIDTLIDSDEIERLKVEKILETLERSIRLNDIVGWQPNDSKYDKIKFNIYRIALKHYAIFNMRIKDFVIEILKSISESITTDTLKSIATSLKLYLNKKVSTIEEFYQDLDVVRYYTEFLNNYKNFDDDFAKNYLEEHAEHKGKNPFIKHVIAYTIAFGIDSESIKEIKFLLNKFERDSVIDLLITIFIIKNYKELSENEKMLLNTLNNKSQQIKLLLINYNRIDKTLKDRLTNLVSNSEKTMLIEAIPQVLLNFNKLPLEVKNGYSFIFESSNEKIKNQIKETFELWVDRYVNDLDDDDVTKWQDLDEKVSKLFIAWLEEGNYSKQLYGYSDEPFINQHERLFYKWIFYSLKHDGKTCFVDENNTIYIKDIDPFKKEVVLTFKEKITPRVREPIPDDLIVTIPKNIIRLLKNLKSPFEKAEVMWVAFLLADKDKHELEKVIIRAIEEDKTVLKAFFTREDCEHFYEYPFKLSDFQEKLIDKMLQYANDEIESAYNEDFCDQRNRSDVNIEDYH